MPDRDHLVLAGLLYDIGIFRQRSFGDSSDPRRQSADWLSTRRFPGMEEVAALVGGRPCQQEDTLELNLAGILAEADSLCYGAEHGASRSQTDSAPTLLAPLFGSSASAVGQGRPPTSTFWPLRPIAPGHVYPQTLSAVEPSSSQYGDLWRAFESEFEVLARAGLPPDAVLVLLEKYCACIPGAPLESVNGGPTRVLSLFDYAKARAAIAGSLHGFFQATYPQRFTTSDMAETIADRRAAHYRLVTGEISGIRPFVYHVNHAGDVAALQARSLFVDLVTRHLVQELVEGLELGWANVVYATDGEFCMLAQNTQGARMRLTKLQQTVNRWLLETFGGALHLAMAHVEARGADLEPARLPEVYREAQDRLEERKRQRFSDVLDTALAPKEPLLKDGYCSMCGGDHYDTDLKDGLCATCFVLARVGRVIPGAHVIAGSRSKLDGPPQIKLPAGDGSWFYYAVLKDEKCLEQGSPDRVFLMDNWDLQLYARPRSYGWLEGRILAGTPAPPHGDPDPEGHPHSAMEPEDGGRRAMSLRELAGASRGQPKLGVLELRVDDLGSLCADHGRKTGLGGMADLHRQTHLFFAGYAKQICRGLVRDGLSPLNISQRGSGTAGNVSILHAGSGGMLAVGAWDEVVALAFDVRDAFASFAGPESDAHLSGSVVVAQPDYPLHRITRLTQARVLDAGGGAVALFCTDEAVGGAPSSPRRSRCVYPWREAREAVAETVRDLAALCKVTFPEIPGGSPWADGLVRGLYPVLAEWEQAGAYYLPGLASALVRTREALGREESVDPRLWQRVSGVLLDAGRMETLRTILTWLGLLAGTSRDPGGRA